MKLIFWADCGEDAGGIETQGQQAAGAAGQKERTQSLHVFYLLSNTLIWDSAQELTCWLRLRGWRHVWSVSVFSRETDINHSCLWKFIRRQTSDVVSSCLCSDASDICRQVCSRQKHLCLFCFRDDNPIMSRSGCRPTCHLRPLSWNVISGVKMLANTSDICDTRPVHVAPDVFFIYCLMWVKIKVETIKIPNYMKTKVQSYISAKVRRDSTNVCRGTSI